MKIYDEPDFRALPPTARLFSTAQKLLRLARLVRSRGALQYAAGLEAAFIADDDASAAFVLEQIAGQAIRQAASTLILRARDISSR